MLKPTIALFALCISLFTACGGNEKPPYFFRGKRDASMPDVDGSAPGLADAGHDAEAEVDDSADLELSWSDDGTLKVVAPSHKSETCSDFSSGAAYAQRRIDNTIHGDEFSELAADESAAKACGYLPPASTAGIYQERIRGTDGRLLYLRNGYIYAFVSDELEGDPFQNDVKLDVPHKCAMNTGGMGPFRSFLIQPDGEIIYECVKDSDRTHTVFRDAEGRIVAQFPGVIDHTHVAVDDHGRMFRADQPIEEQDGSVKMIQEGTKTLTLQVVGLQGCLKSVGVYGARALPNGFLIALGNSCGIQLWRTRGSTTLELVAHYAAATSTTGIRKSGDNYGVLALDGALFYARPMDDKSPYATRCGGTICAMLPRRTAPELPDVTLVRGPASPWRLYDELANHYF